MAKKFLPLAPIAGCLLAALPLLSPGPAKAVHVFVGSWSPYSAGAPTWFGSPPNGPLAYTAQEAAALLFGGWPDQYRISTVDSNPDNINDSAWYDVIGVGGGVYPANYNVKYLDKYYGPTSGYSDVPLSDRAASAYIQDNVVTSVNYAFFARVPGPLPVVGLGAAFGLSRRLRSRIKSNQKPSA